MSIQGQPLEVTGKQPNKRKTHCLIWFWIESSQFSVCAVVSCSKLKDTEWISRQDPYVCVEYGNTKFRTRTCTGACCFILFLYWLYLFCWSLTSSLADGGRNPVFQEKFTFPLIEGLRDINVIVWNSNTLSFDDFIGTGKSVTPPTTITLLFSWFYYLFFIILLLAGLRIQLHKVLSQGYDDSTWPLQSKTGRHAGEVKLILHYAMPNHQVCNSNSNSNVMLHVHYLHS